MFTVQPLYTSYSVKSFESINDAARYCIYLRLQYHADSTIYYAGKPVPAYLQSTAILSESFSTDRSN